MKSEKKERPSKTKLQTARIKQQRPILIQMRRYFLPFFLRSTSSIFISFFLFTFSSSLKLPTIICLRVSKGKCATLSPSTQQQQQVRATATWWPSLFLLIRGRKLEPSRVLCECNQTRYSCCSKGHPHNTVSEKKWIVASAATFIDLSLVLRGCLGTKWRVKRSVRKKGIGKGQATEQWLQGEQQLKCHVHTFLRISPTTKWQMSCIWFGWDLLHATALILSPFLLNVRFSRRARHTTQQHIITNKQTKLTRFGSGRP